MSVNGAAMGCITGNLTLGKTRNINDYSTLCEAADGLAQGTPGQLTITGSATVEYIVGGAGIDAADAAIDSAALVPVVVTFKGQGQGATVGASDAVTLQSYITSVNKTVSPGSATGTVQVDFRAVSIGA